MFGFAGPAVGERAGETGRGGERKEEETRAGMFFCMCVYMYVCMYVCIFLCLYVRICICIKYVVHIAVYSCT